MYCKKGRKHSELVMLEPEVLGNVWLPLSLVFHDRAHIMSHRWRSLGAENNKLYCMSQGYTKAPPS